MYEFIKRFLAEDQVFYGLLLLMVGVGSFGLGRISLTPSVASQPAQVKLTTESLPAAPVETANGQLVASKNGSKYHYLWCPGAQQMNEENKIYFEDATAARAAGYEPAANCQGLE